MTSPLLIAFLAFLLCAIRSCSGQAADASDIYPYYNTSNCVFPFTYGGATYNNCTLDGNNGDRPWCALTSTYNGLFTKCYDFIRTPLQCVFPFTLNGKVFTKCDFLSRTAKYKQCKTAHPIYKYIYCWQEYTKPSNKPLLHSSDCDGRYVSMSPTHSKCAGPDDHAVGVQLTAADKASILDVHNTYRGGVNAAYMFQLFWDEELADLAQTHADMCAFDHDEATNRMTLNYAWKNGQNMVMSTEIQTPLANLLRIMFDSELPEFVYGVGCKNPGTCTHYTQLMISNLTRVGCAQTHCLYPDRIERYLVCNYILSQYSNNYMIPYVQSDTQASACPSKSNNNYTLCNCGNKICSYKGSSEYLDPNTCNCVSTTGKRSIDEGGMSKRNAVNETSSSNHGAFYAAPNGGNLEKAAKKKRHIHKISPSDKHPAKRELRKLIHNTKTKREISSNMADAS